GECRHIATQVVHVENQVFGQIFRLTPNDPAASERRQSELMTGGIDGFHARDAKIPFQLWSAKWGEEAAACSIDMDRNVQLFLSLQAIERGGNRFHRFVGAIEGDTQRRHYTDRVLIASLQDLLGCHEQTIMFHRDFPELNIPVSCKFMPTNLDWPGNQV